MAQLKGKFIEDNAITADKIANDAINDQKIRLRNDQFLRARNAADDADVDLLKVDASDIIQFASVPRVSADATNANELVRKSQVDALLEGLKPKEAVRAASTANVDINTALENGDTLDGVTLATGDRVLLKDQTAALENGIYVVSASGVAFRATDFDQTTPVNEIQGAYVAVQEGTENQGKLFVQSGTVDLIDTDPINFVLFNSSSSLSGGDGIDITGNVVSVDIKDTSGLKFDLGELAVEPADIAGEGLEDDGADALRISSAAAGNGLSGGGGVALAVQPLTDGAISSAAGGVSVNVDEVTIEIAANSLQVKDLGIGTDKIFDGAVNAAKIAADVAGEGLVKNGVTGALDVQVTGGLEISTDSVQIADEGVTAAKIAAAVAGDGLAGGAGTALSVNVDGATIEISSDALQVVDDGITAAKINADVAGSGLVQNGSTGALDVNTSGSAAANFAATLTVDSDTLGVAIEEETLSQTSTNLLQAVRARNFTKVLDATDISNQYVDVEAGVPFDTTDTPLTVSLSAGGVAQQRGVDFTVSEITAGTGLRVTFAGDLATGGAVELEAGDVVVVDYSVFPLAKA